MGPAFAGRHAIEKKQMPNVLILLTLPKNVLTITPRSWPAFPGTDHRRGRSLFEGSAFMASADALITSAR